MLIRFVLSIFLITLLTACQTIAQKDAQNFNSNSQFAKSRVDYLVSKAKLEYPQYFMLIEDMGMTKAGPSIAQRMDETYLSDQEGEIILEGLNGVHATRKAIEDIEVSLFPSNMQNQVRLSAQQFVADTDTIYMKLMQKKITKGQAATLRHQAYLEYQTRYSQILEIYGQALSEQHARELQAQSEALQRLQDNVYRQQLLNTVRRPWYTNCNTNGNMTNCTTY